MKKLSRCVSALPIPDTWAVPLQFRLEFGYWPNLKCPHTFNEHLCALKCAPAAPLLAPFVDKLAARNIAARALGQQALIPLLGVWERPQDVPLAQLPPCALLCTHKSHAGLRLAGPLGDAWRLRSGNLLCALHQVPSHLERWLTSDGYAFARERPYRCVPRRLIALAWIDGAQDYKVMVFNGRPRAIQRHARWQNRPAIAFFHQDGSPIPGSKAGLVPLDPSPLDPGLARRLCRAAQAVARRVLPRQPYLRVDFLVNPQGRIFFGEITFYDSAGLRPFVPDSLDHMFGRWFHEDPETQGF